MLCNTGLFQTVSIVCIVPDRVAGKWYSQWIETHKQAFIHHPWLQLSQELLGRYLMTASQATLRKKDKENLTCNSTKGVKIKHNHHPNVLGCSFIWNVCHLPLDFPISSPMHHPSTTPYDKSMFLVLRSDDRVMNHSLHWHKHHHYGLYQLPSLASLRKNKRAGEIFPKFHPLVNTAAHERHSVFCPFLLSGFQMALPSQPDSESHCLSYLFERITKVQETWLLIIKVY